MNRTITGGFELMRKPLRVLFVGDPGRSKLLCERIKSSWKFHVCPQEDSILAEYDSLRPDFVILDDFPDSDLARSVYYRLRPDRDGPFLALNRTPHALKFMRLKGLSFLKIIDRNPEPGHLMQAVSELLKTNPRFESESRQRICSERGKYDRGRVTCTGNQLEACC